MKNIFIFLLFLTSCSINIKKYSDDFLIQEAIEQIKLKDRSLLKYLLTHPAEIDYNPDSNIKCTKIDKKANKYKILIPIEYSTSKIMTELEIVKALYSYKMLNKYSIENLYETELLSSYKQIEYFLSNVLKKDEGFSIENNKIDNKFIKNLCVYFLSYQSFDKHIQDIVLKNDKYCNYPLESIYTLKNYYDELKKSLEEVDSDSFYRIIYNREYSKVKKGEITKEQFEKKYYYLLSEPQLELYRQQRKEIFFNIKNISDFEKTYKSYIKKFHNKQQKNKELVHLFPLCIK